MCVHRKTRTLATECKRPRWVYTRQQMPMVDYKLFLSSSRIGKDFAVFEGDMQRCIFAVEIIL